MNEYLTVERQGGVLQVSLKDNWIFDNLSVLQETLDKLLHDDIALMEFGDRMVRQIMYAENTIPLKKDALETHLERRGKYREKSEELVPERPSMAAYDMPLDGEDENNKK